MSGLTYDGNSLRTASTTGSATTQYVWNQVALAAQLIMDSTRAYVHAGNTTPSEDPSGLIYFDHRYYDPATAQFMSVDPNLPDTLAPYSYADGDPVINDDPTGLETEKVSDKYHCSMEVDRAHYATKSGYPPHTAVKAKLGIVGCTSIPESAYILVDLMKVGEFEDHWQARGHCYSEHPNKTDCLAYEFLEGARWTADNCWTDSPNGPPSGS